MNGKVAKMSYELLLDYLNALDCDVQITVIPRPPVKPTLTSQEIIHERGHVLVGTDGSV